uniref:PARP-type domain-containing protein n=1 Tax=Aegilops tauschii subsp. strangulata TaxID=200361 RepID=A0A452XNZ3_AEGTS
MAAPPPKAWKAEYAKSGRSSCKSCKSPIAKDALRLGKMVQATQFDGFMPVRNTASLLPTPFLPAVPALPAVNPYSLRGRIYL